MEVAAFAFLSFVFYKVVPAFMFVTGPTVVYCAVMALMTTFIVVGVDVYFRKRSLRPVEGRFSGERNSSFTALIVPILASVAANVVLGIVTVFGFSEDFSRWVVGVFSSAEEITLFIIMLALPPLMFFLIRVWRRA